MRPFRLLLPVLCCLVLAWSPAALARETRPETVVVERVPLTEKVETKGLFVPTRSETLRCEPRDRRGTLEVVEAVREGPVVEGQVLVRFSADDLEKDVAAAYGARAKARLDFERAVRGARLERDERALAMDEAVRGRRLADEALERFVEVERKLRETEAIHHLEGARIRLENQREELAQLEKMYAADDLTEETEEIVLNRARRSYERALKDFEFRKQRHGWFMTETLPREHEKLRLAARKAAAHLDRIRAMEPLDLEGRSLALKHARREVERREEAYAEIREDLEKLAVKAPMAGYAVPGALSGGTWSQLAEARDRLRPGEKLGHGTVLFTIVDPTSLVVETSVKEVDLGDVKGGQPARVTTTLTGDEAIPGEVISVARYGQGGAYAVRIRLAARSERLRAGLGCGIEITRHEPEAVLSVPKSCLEKKDDEYYVYVVTPPGEDSEPERVEVEVGRAFGERREITAGLEPGQVVLKEPPGEASDAK
jgi:hypothetical protein